MADTVEAAKCPCENLKPMKQWIGEEDPEHCRPCALGVIGQWYSDELKEKGLTEQATTIEQLTQNAELSPVAFCEVLDNIKLAVPPEVHQRLLDFDCSIQVNT